MAKRATARNLLVAESKAMARVLARVEELSLSDAPVLIEGEPGSGRELIARLIHLGSPRRSSELVSVSAGAALKRIFDDGISDDDASAFENAEGGTLLVKNLNELTKTSQRKLRRLLATGGSSDVRIIGTCDPDLEGAVAAEMFDSKLFEMLVANRIDVPPLRERNEDIAPLAVKLIGEYARRLGKVRLTVSTRALARMKSHPWPGNVAELKQLCRRLAFRCTKTRIDVREVDALLPGLAERVPLESMSFEDMVRSQVSSFLRRVEGYGVDNLYESVIGRVERPLLELVMGHTGGNQVRAAEMLGMGRNTLRRKLTEHGLLETRSPKRTKAVGTARQKRRVSR